MAQILDLGKLRFNWAGEYNSATEYEYNDVVKYGPNVYAYVAPNSAIGITPTNASRWLLVIEGVRYRGMYTANTLYYVNDLVSDQYSTYIVLTEHTATSDNATVPELAVIAVGQEGIPNQAGNAGKVLTTDGTTPDWTSDVNLNPLHVSADAGNEAIGFEATNGLTDVASIFTLGSEDFVQLAIANTQNGANASTDVIAYTADGDNRSGWIDMGITSKDFDAQTFGITGPHDGYIFMSAPRVDEAVILARKTLAGVAELETLNDHPYVVGQEIHVENVGAAYDGVRIITAVSAKKFQFDSDVENEIRVLLNPYGAVYRPAGHGNLVLATDATGTQNKIVFAAGGFQTGTSQMEIDVDNKVEITIETESTSTTTGSFVTAGGAGIAKDLHVGGSLHTFGAIDFENADEITFGTGSKAFHDSLTHPTLTITENAPDYAQVAFKNFNSSANASTDFIAYASNGDDNSGYIDMGITSETFTDPDFTITGPNDGYIFSVAPEGTTGNGNLVLATGDTGAQNRIVFAAGGLASNNTQMIIIPDQMVHIEIDTPSTSATTGALVVAGGVGITGDVNIAGNITFGGEGTQVGTANLAVSDPMIFVGNDSTATDNDLSFVGEGKYVIPDTYSRTVVNKVLTDNVATLTLVEPYTTAATDWVVGDSIVISGVGAPFDGTQEITALPNPYTVSFAKTNTNIASTRVGDVSATVAFKEVLSNVAKITFTGGTDFAIGESIVITGVGATFNGTHVITETLNNGAAIQFELITGNVSQTASTGTGTVNRSTATAVVTNPVRTRWTAWSKDAFDGVWKLTSNIRVKPTSQIDYTQPDIAYDSIKIQNATVLGNQTVGGTLVTTGNLTVGSNKLTVASGTGNTVIAGTASIGSDLSVNTNKFTVAGSTGNTAIAGTLDVTGALGVTGALTASSTAAVTGNLSVNTDKFTVAAATGNTAVAGTLAVTGGTALTSDLAVNTNKFTVAAATGNTVVAGTLQVAGAVTSTSNITINATPTADTDAATVAVVKTLAGGNWITKTANYTAVSGDLIFADSSTNAFVITLPATPAVNAKVRIHDVASKWHTNPVTVARNGSTIMGLTEDLLLNVKNATVDLVYSGATNGWRIL